MKIETTIPRIRLMGLARSCLRQIEQSCRKAAQRTARNCKNPDLQKYHATYPVLIGRYKAAAENALSTYERINTMDAAEIRKETQRAFDIRDAAFAWWRGHFLSESERVRQQVVRTDGTLETRETTAKSLQRDIEYLKRAARASTFRRGSLIIGNNYFFDLYGNDQWVLDSHEGEHDYVGRVCELAYETGRFDLILRVKGLM